MKTGISEEMKTSRKQSWDKLQTRGLEFLAELELHLFVHHGMFGQDHNEIQTAASNLMETLDFYNPDKK